MNKLLDAETWLLPACMPLLILLTSASMLGSAYYFEYVEGLAPCQLCQYQRLAWWVALGISAAAFYMKRQPRLQNLASGLATLCILAGAGVAGYHVGVEYGYWEGPATCSGSSLPTSLSDLSSMLTEAPPPRCDEVAWSFFGLSMAAYNALISLATGAYVLAVLRSGGRP
ncbi:MAG: disulfide bond formation protein B [Alphaproteobacteria bacterium]